MTTTLDPRFSLAEGVKSEPTPERVPALPENVSIAQGTSPEAEAVVATRQERYLMETEYQEMSQEMLAIAREARAAQIRALPEE